VHDHEVSAFARRESASHRGSAGGSTGNDNVRAFAGSFVPLGYDEHDAIGHTSAGSDAARSHALTVNEGELLGAAEASATARGHHNGRDRHA
jgi:hypothetical protein